MHSAAVEQLQKSKHDCVDSDMLARVMLSSQKNRGLRMEVLRQFLLHLWLQLSLGKAIPILFDTRQHLFFHQSLSGVKRDQIDVSALKGLANAR